MTHIGGLGMRFPTDFEHIIKYPFSSVAPYTVSYVEDALPLPYQYRIRYDQGVEGACVGFGGSWQQSIRNGVFYDARWLYREAQLIDEWIETPPEEGTSVRAAMEILRTVGHRKLFRGRSQEPDLQHGIDAYRWARSVDEMRTAIATGNPITIGVNWYQNFDEPERVGLRERWIGRDRNRLGRIRGGHAVCVYGASDRRQAFKIVNNWGIWYPLVWMPYETMQLLLNQYGEAAIITDFRGTN